jgi:hypothetical protein
MFDKAWSDHMVRYPKALLAAGVSIAALGFALASAAPASAAEVTTVTPSTNLVDTQPVAVFVDSGVPFNGLVFPGLGHVDECVAGGPSGAQCAEIGTIPFDVNEITATGDYVWDGNVNVQQSITPTGGTATTCVSQCFMRFFGTSSTSDTQVRFGTDIALSFKAPK